MFGAKYLAGNIWRGIFGGKYLAGKAIFNSSNSFLNRQMEHIKLFAFIRNLQKVISRKIN